MGSVTKQASTRFSIVKRSKGQSAVEKASSMSHTAPSTKREGLEKMKFDREHKESLAKYEEI